MRLFRLADLVKGDEENGALPSETESPLACRLKLCADKSEHSSGVFAARVGHGEREIIAMFLH